MRDINYLRNNGCIIFECVSGSRSYGLDTPNSDTDIRGVFILPERDFFGLHYTEQVSNESNDVVFYELKRFAELLLRNNPNIIEMTAVPADCILHKDALVDSMLQLPFLSKLCCGSFAKYAFSQIKKARGLNKKIFNPHDRERKSVLDFCYVTYGNGSMPLHEWLAARGYRQEQCGLARLDHMRDMYALYYDAGNTGLYSGIMRKETANDVTLSAVPKGAVPAAHLYFNKDGYSVYCKDYKTYWAWVEQRNEARYENTLEHGKNYDAKNMMHVFRLLNMAEEIASGKGVITRRPDREFLLSIRSGGFSYDGLIERAEAQMERVKELFAACNLPDTPDERLFEEAVVRVRREFYEQQKQAGR